MTAFVPAAPLFVPGHKPQLVAKADLSAADAIFIDLEDAVAPDEKPTAREALQHLSADKALWVRMNDVRSDYFEEDIKALSKLSFDDGPFAGLLVPKLEGRADLEHIFHKLGRECPALGFIETAKGLQRLADSLTHPCLLSVIFGNLDYALDIGAKPIRDALSFARQEIVFQTKLSGKDAPLDGVSVDFKDDKQLADDVAYAAALGFGGKLCIHPAQTAMTIKAFLPSAEEIARANAILEAAGDRLVATLDGQMIDKPVIENAKRIVAKARRS